MALIAAGRQTRRGGAWSDVQVGLTCSSAIGRYEIGRSEQGASGKRVAAASEERETIECSMIVTLAVWEKAQKILQEKSKAPEKQSYLFAGMVWCRCRQKMKMVSEGAKLDCPDCHAKIPAADLEAIFVEDFFDVTSSCPALAAAMSAPSERRELQAKMVDVPISLGEAKARREGVEGMLSSGSISQRRFE